MLFVGVAFPASDTVKAGYTVAVRFANAGVISAHADAEYTGDLGFLNLRWKLVKV